MKIELPNNDTKIVVGYDIGFVVAIAAMVCAVVGGSDAPLQLTLCFLGGALGWTIGIVFSPLDEDETTKFDSMGKAAAAVLSGFVVAKLEEPLIKQIGAALEHDGQLYSFRVALFLTLFVVGFLFTLISRLYSEDAARRRERKQARLLAQAEKLMEKYQKLKDKS